MNSITAVLKYCHFLMFGADLNTFTRITHDLEVLYFKENLDSLSKCSKRFRTQLTS